MSKPSISLAIPLADYAKRILDYHAAASGAATQFAAYATLCGLELRAAKKALGETRGRPKNNSCQNGTNFDEWLEANCPGLSRRTAYRYLTASERVKGKLIEQHGAKIEQLLALPPSQLDKPQRAELLKYVGKITDGKTLGDFCGDYGVAKKPQGSGAKGGNTRKGGSEDSEPQAETAEVLAEGKRAAVRLLLDLLAEHLEDKKFHAADKKTRENLHGLLVDLSAAVKETL